jgi:hypothetical protein
MMTKNLKEYILGTQRDPHPRHWLEQTIMLWPLSLDQEEKKFLKEFLEAADMYWAVVNYAITDVNHCKYITEGHHKEFIISLLTLP